MACCVENETVMVVSHSTDMIRKGLIIKNRLKDQEWIERNISNSVIHVNIPYNQGNQGA